MRTEKIRLYEEREDVILTSYILDDSPEMLKGKKRPAILICPGGACMNCSDREAEPVAIRFAAMGYHAFVLRYSVYMEGKGGFPDITSPLVRKEHCIHPNPIREIGKAILYIGEHAEEWLVDMEKLAICGFSAGAHNCALYAVNWDQPVLTGYFQVEKKRLKPAAVILGYPLTDYCYLKEMMGDDPVAQGLFTISNTAFLGTGEPPEELLREVSPVYHINEKMPPVFIWSTASDDLVPVQHSIRMAHALADQKIPFEMHLFEEGCHGLALADQTSAEAKSHVQEDVGQWVGMAESWLEKRFAYDLPELTDMEIMMREGYQKKKSCLM